MAQVLSMGSSVQLVGNTAPLHLHAERLIDSDLIHLNVFGSPMIVVNSPSAAADLLEKRSLIYSDRFVSRCGYPAAWAERVAIRPQMHMMNELFVLFCFFFSCHRSQTSHL